MYATLLNSDTGLRLFKKLKSEPPCDYLDYEKLDPNNDARKRIDPQEHR